MKVGIFIHSHFDTKKIVEIELMRLCELDKDFDISLIEMLADALNDNQEYFSNLKEYYPNFKFDEYYELTFEWKFIPERYGNSWIDIKFIKCGDYV